MDILVDPDLHLGGVAASERGVDLPRVEARATTAD